MECPARQTLVQLIPLVNNSAIDYNINYNLKSENKMFTGAGENSVKRGVTFN